MLCADIVILAPVDVRLSAVLRLASSAFASLFFRLLFSLSRFLRIRHHTILIPAEHDKDLLHKMTTVIFTRTAKIGSVAAGCRRHKTSIGQWKQGYQKFWPRSDTRCGQA